jgi:hypothetical protein
VITLLENEAFFEGGVCGVLLGFLRKQGVLMVCFCGEFVVECVANVVLKQSSFVVIKNRTRFQGLFLHFPFWNERGTYPSRRSQG